MPKRKATQRKATKKPDPKDPWPTDKEGFFIDEAGSRYTENPNRMEEDDDDSWNPRPSPVVRDTIALAPFQAENEAEDEDEDEDEEEDQGEDMEVDQEEEQGEAMEVYQAVQQPTTATAPAQVSALNPQARPFWPVQDDRIIDQRIAPGTTNRIEFLVITAVFVENVFVIGARVQGGHAARAEWKSRSRIDKALVNKWTRERTAAANAAAAQPANRAPALPLVAPQGAGPLVGLGDLSLNTPAPAPAPAPADPGVAGTTTSAPIPSGPSLAPAAANTNSREVIFPAAGFSSVYSDPRAIAVFDSRLSADPQARRDAWENYEKNFGRR